METQTQVLDPFLTVSESNRHEHWRRKAKRAAWQREAAANSMRAYFKRPTSGPIRIHLVRLGPKKLDKGGNLAIAFKAIQDGVADWLEIDDGDDRLTWTYAQEPHGKPKKYAIRIEVTA